MVSWVVHSNGIDHDGFHAKISCNFHFYLFAVAVKCGTKQEWNKIFIVKSTTNWRSETYFQVLTINLVPPFLCLSLSICTWNWRAIWNNSEMWPLRLFSKHETPMLHHNYCLWEGQCQATWNLAPPPKTQKPHIWLISVECKSLVSWCVLRRAHPERTRTRTYDMAFHWLIQ